MHLRPLGSEADTFSANFTAERKENVKVLRVFNLRLGTYLHNILLIYIGIIFYTWKAAINSFFGTDILM
jgi:hypothetical protein